MEIEKFRTEVFLREDVKNMLTAVDVANTHLAMLLPGERAAIYRAGFSAAMQAMAAAFDVTIGRQESETVRNVRIIEPELKKIGSHL